ncbi:MAG TPA: hypothetical protein VNO52_08025 [Methylomirabilota bacterium]|nr:hypothetical protein [Methylomirabilota bacterium]
MKNRSVPQKSHRHRFALGLVVAILTTCGAPALHAQTYSPVGTWDCVLSGGKVGTARITFNADYTLDGIQIRYSRSSKGADSNPRGGTDNRGETEETSSGSGTNLYGGAILVGEWGYDSENRVVGYIAEVSSGNTNEVSIQGTARASSRLTLRGSAGGANFTIRGQPTDLGGLTDISGDYAALGRHGEVPFTEFLQFDNVSNGEYDIEGTGPGYTLTGFALLVRQNQLGMYLERTVGSNVVITAVSGPIKINANPRTANLKGTDEAGGVRYKLVRQVP